MKRIIALLLTLLLLLPMVISCSDKNTESPESNEASTSEDSGLLLSDKVKGVKFNGEDINIWQVTNASNAAEYFYDMNGDMGDGDVISQAIFKRNAKVEQYLNVNVNFVDTGSYSNNAATDCRVYLTAGSSEFDAYELIQWNGISLVIEGWFANLDETKYLDFSGEWWSEDFLNAAKINGNNYVMAGDVGIDMVSCSAAIFVNKKILSNYYGGDAYSELRTKILDGNWTIDEMTKLSKGIYSDLNNNQTVDIEDQFGFLCNSSNNIDGWYFGAGGTAITRDSDGKAVISMGTEHTVNIMDRIYHVMYTESPQDFGHYAGETKIEGATMTQPVVKKFSLGQTLFCTGFLYTARNLTNMTDEFGVLPYPKYNTDQTEYHSVMHNIVTLFAIPNSCTKLDQTSAAFEVMASVGKQDIVPLYYETVLKIRNLNDPEDAKLIDLIYDSRMTDIAIVFESNAYMIPRNMIQNGNKNMPYYIETYSGKIQEQIDKINGIGSDA